MATYKHMSCNPQKNVGSALQISQLSFIEFLPSMRLLSFLFSEYKTLVAHEDFDDKEQTIVS